VDRDSLHWWNYCMTYYWFEVGGSRHELPDCIVLVKCFVRLHTVENPVQEMVKGADLNCMQEVGHREIPHNTGNMSDIVYSLVNMAPRQFSIGGLLVGIAQCSTSVLIPLGVLLVSRDTISQCILWILAVRTCTPASDDIRIRLHTRIRVISKVDSMV
jgi:hypothetical protein